MVSRVEVMSPLDSAFLRMEDRHTSLHIASVAIFDGPPLGYEDLAELVAAKLPLMRRYRQRVREVPLGLGRPVWVDDPHFALGNHLRLTSVSRPGTRAQLDELVGRLMSHHLDRDRPLWECWLVHGLEDGRWAMINKVHHCMADGIAGTDFISTMLDHGPTPAPPVADTWDVTSEPGRLRLLSTAVAVPFRPSTALTQLSRTVRHPTTAASNVVTRLHGMLGFAGLARPATHSSLSGPVGSTRRWASARVSLDDVRTIRAALGGTVNDVVLAAVTSAFRDLLLSRGERPESHTLRTLVPVSVRTGEQRGQADNRVSAVVAELPVHLADPVTRLAAVRTELDRLKVSGEAQAGEFMTELGRFVPPILLQAGLSGAFLLPQHSIVTVATNVPGPRIALYAAGRQLRELYPYVPIADRIRTGVAIFSYVGTLHFGVTADRDSTPDIGVLTSGIEDAIRELVKATEQQGC